MNYCIRECIWEIVIKSLPNQTTMNIMEILLGPFFHIFCQPYFCIRSHIKSYAFIWQQCRCQTQWKEETVLWFTWECRIGLVRHLYCQTSHCIGLNDIRINMKETEDIYLIQLTYSVWLISYLNEKHLEYYGFYLICIDDCGY